MNLTASAPSRVRRNVLANFVGRGWTALLALFFVPLYLHFLGIEVYGLIGVFATLQAVSNLLDLGLGATLNRELARLSTLKNTAMEQRNLLRTLEVTYWGLAALAGGVIFLAAPAISAYWIHPVHISTASVTTAVRLMGVTVVVQLPFALYQGGLLGMQRHVLLNAILTAAGTARSVGAVIILWQVSRTIEAFLAWQCLVSLAVTAVTSVMLGRSLPMATRKPEFDRLLLGRVWRFAAALTGIAAINFMFSQTDKVILSRWLALDEFGYYMLAQSLAGVLWSVVGPFSAAVFPRFSQLAAAHATTQMSDLYHRACQTLSVVLIPLFLMLVFFSHPILLTWTLNPVIARHAWAVLSLAACGAVSICLADIPHFLRLAYGWYLPSLVTSAILVAAFIPLVVVMTRHFGVIGAAATWASVNAFYLVTVAITHTRILRGEFRRWCLADIGMPSLGSLLVIVIAYLIWPPLLPRATSLLMLVSTWSAATIAAAFLSRNVRLSIVSAGRRWFSAAR